MASPVSPVSGQTRSNWTRRSVLFSSHQGSLQEETQKDVTLSALQEMVTTGSPDRCQEVPKPLRPYWGIRDELSVEHGLVTKGDRIVVPTSMRQEILSSIHAGHQGSEKCKQSTRTCVNWPLMNNDIEELIHECPTCQTHCKSRQPETLIGVWLRHSGTSPEHGILSTSPARQAKGLIDRFSDTVKETLIKAPESNLDPDMALRCLQATPIDSALPSSGELLKGRKLHNNLPTKICNNDPSRDAVREWLQSRHSTQKAYHDSSARDLPPTPHLTSSPGSRQWSVGPSYGPLQLCGTPLIHHQIP